MGLNQSICQPEGMQKNIGFMVKQKSFLFDKVYTYDYKLMSHYDSPGRYACFLTT